MNLDKTREIVRSHLGQHISFIYKGSRNQVEKFNGVITKCFPSIFIIETDNNTIKSFTYNDFIIKSIRIIS